MKNATNKGAFRFAAVAAIAFAMIATPFASVNAADAPSLGAKCSSEGVTTGNSANSLVCVKGKDGSLKWQRVKLSNSDRKSTRLNSSH